MLRTTIISLLATVLLTAGCRQEPGRHPNAGLTLVAPVSGGSVVPTDGESAAHALQEAEIFAALEAVLAKEPEEIVTYVDPDLPLQTMLDDPGRAFGRVFAVRGGLKQFWPKRDSARIPDAISEVWAGFVFDQHGSHQPYRIIFAGTPGEETEFEGERVVVVGVFVHLFRYEDRAGREQVAPVLVTSDIRKLTME